MKYKISAFIISLILILGGILRFSHINKEMQIYNSTKKIYNIGDEVPFEKDFFFNAGEIADGYSITVLDTSYFTINEFKEKYNINDDSLLEFSEYVYIIRVKFKNNNTNSSEKTGINISHLILQETSFISYPDMDTFMFLNDFDYFGFSLSSNKEREFIIPFGINEDYININELINGDTKLVVTLYPNKKMINLN